MTVLTTKKSKEFWTSLFWARDKAREEVVEVIRGCILALVESGKYCDTPSPIQISQAIAHLHDAYYQGNKWKYDFDAKLDVAPGKRYYVRPQVSKFNEHIFDFMSEKYSPWRVVPGKNVNWNWSIQCEICTRDMAGAMFAIAEERIMQAGSVVYPPYYRKLKQHIQQVEAAG